ncbi:DUF6520 family protein [Mucilaginibacter aquatilis]|uniref:Uncharacterized protein n=1 Tax=Mucilaginibacter aquatilis TaxID=1517760 RepID=A0A6I4ICA4_9SPHI|nr:DUF6520 family protein [Mucilaginibacter aquatilis]MVN91488.1 hypothetical protein [Mucilaginibacter aquatilis]
MKKLVLPALAIALAFGTSAFTAKKVNSNFYAYTGSAAQADIQNINNYVATATNPCSGAQDVCGVTLSTSRAVGQTPVASEFNAEKANLWASQQAHAPADPNIDMKN